jgi:cytochrome c oxidase subunit 1
MALMQALSRASLDLPYRTAKMYYLSVTAHGVLMALVFTTFFIMSFGYVVIHGALRQEVKAAGVAWAGFWTALLGVGLAAWAILSGKATVSVHVLPAAQGTPGVLHRAHLGGGRVVVVVRGDDRQLPGVEARAPG